MSTPKLLLVTPPLTQLNTPYPATAYLTGYLRKEGYDVDQMDLGIEFVTALFSEKTLAEIFTITEENQIPLSDNCFSILYRKEQYLDKVETVIKFLQGKDESLCYQLSKETYLPQAGRFEQHDDVEWAFGNMGIRDKARFYSTLFLEDLGDFVKEAISPEFEFTKYAEKMVSSRRFFNELKESIESENTYADNLMLEIFDQRMRSYQPDVVGCSVPFPGNLFAGFKLARHIKENYPLVKTFMGGGFVNTELREISNPDIFNYFDYITLDDGELPVKHLLDGLHKESPKLTRTYLLEREEIKFIDNTSQKNLGHDESYTPTYRGLDLSLYLSVLDVINPMHRLWSDGRWNKLTIAHGCYWKKCSFCDITLDYIGRYKPEKASVLVDQIEALIDETGTTGFHFVDEAAPPAAMRDLAIEIIKRKLQITWWTNIRFEKNFSEDLCTLLAKSGCIAVTGGLEVASDRLLKLMEKGVTIDQVAQVTKNFSKAGILVHAYLMYGFPTQTEQETIDALEVVRQLFINGLIHSAFWHRFTATTHSPVGMNPEIYNIEIVNDDNGDFANNDLEHNDREGCDHDAFTEGLNKALYNYMHGIGLDYPVYEWFDFYVPKTKIGRKRISNALKSALPDDTEEKSRLLYVGNRSMIFYRGDDAEVHFFYNGEKTTQTYTRAEAEIIENIIESCSVKPSGFGLKFTDFVKSSEINMGVNALKNSRLWSNLRKNGLLVLKN